MEPDLSKSITMHPHPFRLHTPSHLANSSRRGSMSLAGEEIPTNASSTALEAAPPPPISSQSEKHEAVARHSTAVTDVEGQPRLRSDSDPYGLSSAFKTPEDLAQIKANTSRKREPAGKGSSGGGVSPWRQSHKVQQFYETQNAAIERMLKSVDEHVADARQEAGDDQLQFRIAVWGSFGANVVLTALQLYAAISTGSLSLITTMADAIFDPLSNLTLILASRAIKRVNPRRFPAGKARLETVGNIVFCFLMISVSLIIIAFAARELASRPSTDETKPFRIEPIVAVCVAFATKFVLFLYCFSLRNRYSQVRILWSDHRNDLLVNGFGILTSVGGSKLKWYIDPTGAIVLSLVVSGIWLRTAIAEFLLLVGVTASVETQQLITYVCLTHSPAIQGIDTVRVYHSGPRLIAEVDIVMGPENTLTETHDVAEALQVKLESLPDVERAYVHIDYETTHKPEHAFKKDL
ncbi:cation diffusion facilitator 1 [Colletotrichum tofieldiae]|uniref:Cation diffusion facilitator 1 (Cation efflux family protein) n=1 Tax=Colletotrichum tofieldiae TaxID=708197 RepID=A0A161Y7D8_9PEZI|nr:cation diffusion facilitator 1 (cation efflux family protein) [Colletotrichum tofieldiae]GKT66683.1 cation diffusion facilitator 1 [Colletotrichum tofieldiae]GKT71750.1 cation diffusion facilitator 1 [Colletotrichum tofieldiae]GKT95081.1 cation diffusion facilitator 1 [Colletotrichum tofieldiae]